jgi:excisionase family DNA binding protein
VEQLLTIRKAAEQLAVSPEFIKRLCRRGALRVVRLGRAVRVPQHELERLCREDRRDKPTE